MSAPPGYKTTHPAHVPAPTRLRLSSPRSFIPIAHSRAELHTYRYVRYFYIQWTHANSPNANRASLSFGQRRCALAQGPCLDLHAPTKRAYGKNQLRTAEWYDWEISRLEKTNQMLNVLKGSELKFAGSPEFASALEIEAAKKKLDEFIKAAFEKEQVYKESK
ncbi:hypothetical protein FRC12_016044 [Ceratobasidium sp. 428]|nr:hypothetical protein FRC12_016044 [Ceratobasidium sp. 428]